MKKIIITLIGLFSPVFTFAEGTIKDLVISIKGLLDSIIPILITLGLVYFLWGITEFIRNSGDEKKRDDGKQKIIGGIISLFVILSVWGLVSLVSSTFGIKGGGVFEVIKLL